MKHREIFIGYDTRWPDAFAVARASVRRHLTQPIPIRGLVLQSLQRAGLYTRPTESKINGDGRLHLIDVLSKRSDYDGVMATEFAISRFLAPQLVLGGLALFMDCDMLARANLARLFEEVEATAGKALYCVHHDYRPTETVKMDGQVQTQYARKNWSSVMVIDCDHPANKRLTPAMVNTLPGADLHRFCWLEDDEIGAIGPEWNYLIGHHARGWGDPPDPIPENTIFGSPLLVHFTTGVPSMAGHENDEFADEWRAALADWAR